MGAKADMRPQATFGNHGPYRPFRSNVLHYIQIPKAVISQRTQIPLVNELQQDNTKIGWMPLNPM